jgi:hypothetical protein
LFRDEVRLRLAGDGLFQIGTHRSTGIDQLPRQVPQDVVPFSNTPRKRNDVAGIQEGPFPFSFFLFP